MFEAPGAPEVVTLPFEAAGELTDFLLVWFDGEGVHSAQSRSEVPEERREHVRIEPLSAAQRARLDPDYVFVADLRTQGEGGRYLVRRARREWFDALVERAQPKVVVPDASEVVLYKAAWCGACKSAAAFLRERGVPFVERDVEKDPGAQAEMMRKARAKGLTPTGVPVIDFRGEILLGYDAARLRALVERMPKSI